MQGSGEEIAGRNCWWIFCWVVQNAPRVYVHSPCGFRVNQVTCGNELVILHWTGVGSRLDDAHESVADIGREMQKNLRLVYFRLFSD